MFGGQGIELFLAQAVKSATSGSAFGVSTFVDHIKHGLVRSAQGVDDFFVRRVRPARASRTSTRISGFGNGASWDCCRIKGQHAFVGRRIEAARVDQPEVPIAVAGIGIVAVARHARHVVHNRGSGAENAVEQRRFADVGPSDQGDNGVVDRLQA